MDNFGINRSRLTAAGFDNTCRFAYKTSAEGQQEDRRVNIILNYPNWQQDRASALLPRPDGQPEGGLMSHVHIHRAETVKERTLPAFAEAEHMLQRIQQRAFELFAGRGFGNGRALDDWLTAERELCWPTAEVVDSDKEYVVSVALPGFEAGEVEVTAAPRELIVHAKSSRKRTHANTGTEGKLSWSAFRSSGVFRRIELPADVRVKEVEASAEHGLLTIVAPKTEVAAKRAAVATRA